jgi:hypothetical protein
MSTHDGLFFYAFYVMYVDVCPASGTHPYNQCLLHISALQRQVAPGWHLRVRCSADPAGADPALEAGLLLIVHAVVVMDNGCRYHVCLVQYVVVSFCLWLQPAAFEACVDLSLRWSGTTVDLREARRVVLGMSPAEAVHASAGRTATLRSLVADLRVLQSFSSIITDSFCFLPVCNMLQRV